MNSRVMFMMLPAGVMLTRDFLTEVTQYFATFIVCFSC